MKILFVCTGNTCRSPMAAALLKDINKDIEVQSAGIFAVADQEASEHTVSALAECGISIDHQSQPVTEELLNWADLVFTMTIQHKQSLMMNYPHYEDKLYTLKEYVLNVDNKHKGLSENEAELEDRLTAERMKDDREETDQLDASLLTYDISDPFGGDLTIYRNTLNEIKEYIVLLNKKLT